jgi:hypothetical protein
LALATLGEAFSYLYTEGAGGKGKVYPFLLLRPASIYINSGAASAVLAVQFAGT